MDGEAKWAVKGQKEETPPVRNINLQLPITSHMSLDFFSREKRINK